MIFVYEKGTNKLVGLATQVFDNGKWREPTVEELYGHKDISKYGHLYVKDHPKYSLEPDAWEFKLDKNGTPVDVVRKKQPPKIVLSTDAKDKDKDGMPELPADGSSKAKIIIEIQDHKGEVVGKDFDLKVSTSGGRLSAKRLKAKKGKAEIELTSVVETLTITVKVTAEGAQSASLTFELMPVDT